MLAVLGLEICAAAVGWEPEANVVCTPAMTITGPESSEAVCGTNQAGGFVLFEITVDRVVPVVCEEADEVRLNDD